MILPMKKVVLLVQDRSQDEALIKLRKLGVLHLNVSKAASEKLAKAIDRRTQIENADALIQPFKLPNKKPEKLQMGGSRERRLDDGPRRGRRATDKAGDSALEPFSVDAVNAPKRPDLVLLMLDMANDRKLLEEKDAFLSREQGRLAAWGNFDPRAVSELSSLGQKISIYELSRENFEGIPSDACYIKISEDKSTVRLVLLDGEIPDIAPFQLPEKSLSQINAELGENKGKLLAINKRIESFVTRRPILKREMAGIQREINFELVRANLEKVEDLPPGLGFSHVSGYVPAEDMHGLKVLAAENSWALLSKEPALEDNEIPTKLKNSRIVKFLYPLTDFLDLVPGYREVDVSPWFLLFFTIFFWMIFGDAAYGLLLFFAAMFGIMKTAKTGIPLALRMLCLFSISNVVWGTLTCTWFGVETDKLPQFLRDISLSYISAAKTDGAIVDQNLQIFCFSLALLQLSIARIGAFFRSLRERNLILFSHLGSLAMLLGMFNVVLFLVVSNEQRSIPLLPASVCLLAGGFFLVFVFGYYEGSVVQSILSSLKNIISVVLGITGVFSDVMSYIRLWAVGLAGASLAATINTMAGPMLGNFLVFLGIILLCFGHGLNIILNTLSVLVHGVRLNILEFSGHAGLAWSGIAYKPFAETASNKE